MKKILITENGNIPVGIYNVETVEEHWNWGYHGFYFQLSDGTRSGEYPMPRYHYYIVNNRNITEDNGVDCEERLRDWCENESSL